MRWSGPILCAPFVTPFFFVSATRLTHPYFQSRLSTMHARARPQIGTPFRIQLVVFGSDGETVLERYTLRDHIPHNDDPFDEDPKYYFFNIDIPDIECIPGSSVCRLQVKYFVRSSRSQPFVTVACAMRSWRAKVGFCVQ